MNIAEANLLDRSFDRLGDTFLRNRMLEEQKREREANLGLQRDEVASRMADREDMRENRRLTLAAQREAAANLAKYREAMATAKTEKDKMQLWSDLLKSGSLDQSGLDAMAAEMSKILGVQVKLAMPPEKGFNTREGHNLQLAEQYRERARAALRNGAGDESERFNAIADRLERGGTPADEQTATITRRIMADGADPFGEPLATVTRKVPVRDLDSEMRKIQPPQPAAAAAPAAAPAAATGAVPEFQTEDAARAAGHKAGDIVRLMINGKSTKVRLK